MDWAARLRDAARRAGVDLDVDVIEELAGHARTAAETARADGAAPADADALVESLMDAWIANASALRRRPRRAPVVIAPGPAAGRLGGLVHDVRYSLRTLLRHRAFTGIATVTIAAAIAVVTTVFSIVHGVLLRPLPWPDQDRLVRLTETHAGATRQMPLTMTNISYLPWLDRPETIEAIGAWSETTVTIAGAGEIERIAAAQITPSVFGLMRATPLAGALFTRDDAAQVVLARAFWQSRFGGDLAAVGTTIQLNGRPFEIAGVMPDDFAFPNRDVRLWRPLAIPPVVGPDGTSRYISTFNTIARLKPGATPVQAAAEATARARTGPDVGLAAMAVFGTNSPAEVVAVPVIDAVTGDVKPALLALLIAAALLLATAVANIASLQLARATTRQRELAIRSALGAGTSRLVQQLFAENVTLALAGGGAGLALSAGLHRLLPMLLPADFPRAGDIALGWPVALFTLAVTAIAGVMLGVLPALNLRRRRLGVSLAGNASAVVGGSRTRARRAIMSAQVAMASVLIFGAVLLTRSVTAMATQDRGFDPEHVLTARLSMLDFAFTPQARLDALDALLPRIQAMPGVIAATFSTGVPLSGSENLSAFTMPSVRPPVGASMHVHAVRAVVTPDFLPALGLRLVKGRTFQAADDSPAARRVVVVNRTFAREYLTESAIGDRVRNFILGDAVDFEVIGVVDDMLRRGLTDAVQPEIYSLLHQSGDVMAGPVVVIRSSGDPAALGPALRQAVKAIAPAATVDSMRTMEARIAATLSRPRLYATVVSTFGAAALGIAAVGLFGVLSYVVAQRRREMALRAALGARPSDVFGLVLRQGLVMTIAGVAIGTAAAFAAGRYLGSLLYGVAPHDAASFATVIVLVPVMAIAACLVPALRAMRIDPITALRH
jgi:putative ABC transport system permease protein